MNTVNVTVTVPKVSVTSYGSVTDTAWQRLCAVRARARELGATQTRAPFVGRVATLYLSWPDAHSAQQACTVLTMQFAQVLCDVNINSE
jgi:hypothetical protein